MTTTTTTNTTTTTTTTTPTTAPSGPSLAEYLGSQGDLSETFGLLQRVGLLDELQQDGAQPFTLFAPDDDAIRALRDSGFDLSDDQAVRDLLLAHLAPEALTSQQLLSMQEVAVEDGGPQPIDASANPPTIGGAPLVRTDAQVDGGVVHVLGATLTPQP